MSPSRARIGVLVPAGNVVHEREFARLRPEGVEFRFLGFPYPPAGPDYCREIINRVADPVAELAAWGADLILLGCTTASMACDGADFNAQLEAMAGTPVLTSASASRQALEAFGARSVGVATPYGEANNRIIADFLAASGFGVAKLEGLNLDRSVETWVAGAPTLTPELVLNLSRNVAGGESADTLYLPCTGMGSLDAMDCFERETGKPAVSSVQAGYWASLRRLGLDGRQSGAGRLLAEWDLPG